ncbi:hypothetical protein ELQ92_00915 [Labedella populi]|uniref:Uncharacterized protein n=1 Tax=Labedella populi TaxID=2498850 RepID=A0A3S4E761_9MICO|nr:hypothetical protein [Labedella populi]RWZ67864.1 hypothetical protein ELQ92_00915 [Labedella populi]
MRDVTTPSPRKRRIVDGVSWVVFVAWLILCIGMTVWTVVEGRDPGILIILWPLLLFMAIGPIRSMHGKHADSSADD